MEKRSVTAPAWILCRNRDQFPVQDEGTLLLWVRQGRVQPSDYLVDPRRETCVQASDVATLAPIFRAMPAQRLGSAARRFALASLALLWIAPLAGSVALLAAVFTGLACLMEEP